MPKVGIQYSQLFDNNTFDSKMKNSITTQNLLEVKKLALTTLGSKDVANQWLNSFNLILGDTLVNFMNQQNGPDEIKKILHSISYGGVV